METHEEWLNRLDVVIGKQAAVRLHPDNRFMVHLKSLLPKQKWSLDVNLDDIQLDVARLAMKGQPFLVRLRLLLGLRA